MNKTIGSCILLSIYLLAFGAGFYGMTGCPCCHTVHAVPYAGCDMGERFDYSEGGSIQINVAETHGCCGDVNLVSTSQAGCGYKPVEDDGTSDIPCRCSIHANAVDGNGFIVSMRANIGNSGLSPFETIVPERFGVSPLACHRTVSHSSTSPPDRLLHRCLILIV